ncbi:Helicase PriA essential for oriC/DnaA-independent DNA replication [hydrothermal vent metagenome]|uniref:DNA 3'-5' helicase n=2 Tax=hydrothermal vent metagenome TaxID=652676 RepID=A0A3B0WK67_9ZZZZ
MPPLSSQQRFVKIAVPCPLYKTFDYCLPALFKPMTIEPGVRVRIPFGRQKLIGIVIKEIASSNVPVNKLKPVIAVLDEHNLFSTDVLKLLFWAAKYYIHPLGDVLQTALPVYLRNNDDATPSLNPYWRLKAAPAQSSTEEILQSLKRAPKQLQLYQLLLTAEDALDGEALSALTENWRAPIKALLEKQLVESFEKPAILSPQLSQQNNKNIQLNDEQITAIKNIEAHRHQHAAHVVNGITGSGKTEVYLALCESMLADNKQILVLVPEIGLTPQLTQRFLARLNANIVVLHSAMNDKQRYAAWHAAANNQAQLVIGTRSSIFTPLPNLGLIIIDEEHDGSYKQQDGFRYNARDLAILRAKNKDIPIVLGSATPSLESLNNINEQRYQVHYLKQRANKKPLPKIQLINLCSQKLHEGLAETLLAKIKQHLDQQGQVLLFINRRGFAPLLMCHDCGWTTNCQRCDAHMTFHKRRKQLHCHHCGSQRHAPELCDECGSSNILAIGAGTERIEYFLQDYFPDTKVSRIDRDTTRNKGSLQTKLEQAHSGESGILVGTQMLAKGHDFPNLTLVCVLDTDQALFSADFRAAEHLAQLITQVSGRAGRAEKPGEVLIQTHHPDHPLLQTLLHNGYQAFAKVALQERRDASLPPIRHLALLRCESVEADAAQTFLQHAADNAKQLNIQNIELFGPIPAPMERRAGRYRYQIMLQSKQRKTLHQFLSNWIPQLQQLTSARKVRWSIDVDPYDTF